MFALVRVQGFRQCGSGFGASGPVAAVGVAGAARETGHYETRSSCGGAHIWLRSVLLPTSATYGMALPWKVRRTSLNQSSKF